MLQFDEHTLYIKKIKLEKLIVNFISIFIFASFILLWEILSRNGIIDTFIFSSPTQIFKTLFNLIKTNSLFIHIKITFYEILISFIISILISFIISTLMWLSKILSKILDPYLTIINSLPKVALGPLIIIWFGASIKSIIFMSLLISTFITIINIYNGFISTNNNYITLMKSFGASKFQIYKYVIIPSNYTNIISALKINISMNFIGVIMGELLVSKQGIGYLIMYGSQVFNINLVITGIFLLGIISFILYYFITLFDKK